MDREKSRSIRDKLDDRLHKCYSRLMIEEREAVNLIDDLMTENEKLGVEVDDLKESLNKKAELYITLERKKIDLENKLEDLKEHKLLQQRGKGRAKVVFKPSRLDLRVVGLYNTGKLTYEGIAQRIVKEGYAKKYTKDAVNKTLQKMQKHGYVELNRRKSNDKI